MGGWNRRRLLQAALAAGGVSLFDWRDAWAQTQGRTLFAAPRPPSASAPGSGSLLTAPRRALVIGNSAYPAAPLKNPANDAKAIAGELKRQGFEVTMGLDLKRAEMLEMISAYAQALARSRPVALFYFAGHGLQLAWRNYLVPVDAVINGAADVQAHCVDVNSLIEAIGKAANPMNVIILDACRDNPLGRGAGVEQKGLSQLDAPPGTLLAYATSPGNIASDGDGANGLYTEHLLREMRVPEAKIEDVFKRVRLGVRRRSKGRQIPWESTSLEEDFWFIPPKGLRDISEEEAERLYKEEAGLWERVRKASEPGPLEEYLRRYPSGRFAELAQVHLDRVLAAQGEKKIEVAEQAQNPYTLGSAAANTLYRVGDSYTYNAMDPHSRFVTRTYSDTITKITDSEVIYDDGKFITDLLGNTVRLRSGRQFSPNQFVPSEYTVGKRWTTRFIETHPQFGQFRTEANVRITARERITVPAGAFHTFRIEMSGDSYGGARHRLIDQTSWFAPDRCRRPIARNIVRRAGQQVIESERIELLSFKQAYST